ncbi:Txe/YoeB family addiction module toxin [Oxalobacter paraformigenes]|uniref:Putative mRNA interferase YoeB n=1 Tax=Oxalobacter paraformigenes TaxID=556268 RepID=T5LE83_9BURK|nr:Txe/YoeB family addiction module toxin [Oxalobacter paraformigenes]EQM95176.1 txe/YoeB family addiction module toxin [Oxalobacter paraformigenes]
MNKLWTDNAWEDYLYWQQQDKKTLKRIHILLKDIERNHEETGDESVGIGKPEPLKYELQGFWSRRIDEENRLVYRVNNDVIEILSCKTHYKKN